MIGALSLVVLASVAQDKTLSFDSAGETVPQLVARLGEAARSHYFAAPAFNRDVLIMRFHDAKIEDIRAEIARMVMGKWEKTNDGWNLVRDTQAELAAQKEDTARIAKDFAKQIKKRADAAAKLTAFTEAAAKDLALKIKDSGQPNSGRFDQMAYQRQQTLEQGSPGGRAMSRMIMTLDPVQLAELPDNYRVVFSTQPTKMQRALPEKTLAFLNDLIKEQNIWADALNQAIPETNNNQFYSTSMYQRGRMDKPVGKVLLALTKNVTTGSGVTCEIKIADKTGKVMFENNDSLADPTSTDRTEMPTGDAKDDEPLELDENAKALKEMFLQAMRTNGRGFTMPDRLKKLFLNPAENEPLSLFAGPALLQVAAKRGKNLIAAVPDMGTFMVAFSFEKNLTSRSLLNSFQMMNLLFDESGPTMRIRPQSLLGLRTSRADRTALTKYLKQVVADGRVTIDSSAEYAQTSPGQNIDQFGTMLPQILLADGEGGPYEYSDGRLLKFYGSLSSNQKSAFKTGQPLLLRNLSQAQIDMLTSTVYGSYPNLTVTAPPEAGRTPNFDWDAIYNTLMREPTESMPNGFPSSTTITCADSARPVVMMTGGEGGGDMPYISTQFDEDSLAQYLLGMERPDVMPWYTKYPKPDEAKFDMKTQRSILFDFKFTDALSYQGGLTESTSLLTKKVAYKDLPEDFRKKVAVKLEQLRKAYKDVKPGEIGGGGGGGEQLPPPPRS